MVLYLLVICTILSFKIEDTMMTKVVAQTLSENSLDPQKVKETALFSDMMGDHLYEVTEGVGWNTGLRAAEYPESYYNKDYMTVAVYGELTYIVTASRQPREGEQIDIISLLRDVTKAEDDYLVIYPYGQPDWEAIESGPDGSAYNSLMKKVQMAAESENALLLHVENGQLPYTEQAAKTNLVVLAGPDWKIYRTADVEQTLKMLPLLALLIVVVALPVAIWAYTCVLARKEDENSTLIKVNAGIIVVLLGVMCILLWVIELPASLMPLDNIFDKAHYSQTFGSIFGALESMGSAGQSILTLASQMEAAFWITLAVGALVCALPVVIEIMIVRKGRMKV